MLQMIRKDLWICVTVGKTPHIDLFMHNCSAKRYKMEQTLGLSHGIMLISQIDAQFQDKASKGQFKSEEDFIDTGTNTHSDCR